MSVQPKAPGQEESPASIIKAIVGLLLFCGVFGGLALWGLWQFDVAVLHAFQALAGSGA